MAPVMVDGVRAILAHGRPGVSAIGTPASGVHPIRALPRSSFVGVPAPEHLSWVIEPLVVAGLEREQIESLVFRLAFDGIIGRAGAGFMDPVRDQPPSIQAAWTRVIGRMLAAPRSTDVLS